MRVASAAVLEPLAAPRARAGDREETDQQQRDVHADHRDRTRRRDRVATIGALPGVLAIVGVEALQGSGGIGGRNDQGPAVESPAKPVRDVCGGENDRPLVGTLAAQRDAHRRPGAADAHSFNYHGNLP